MYTQEEKDGMAMKNATIDKFAARGDGEKLNRGDRMVARGERKVDRATAQLGSKLEKIADREQNKLERKENRAGDFPTLRQSEKIASAKKEAKKSGDDLNIYKQTNTASKLNRKYSPSRGNYLNGIVNIENENLTLAKQKAQKGERLAKKGEMLSARINNRRRG